MGREAACYYALFCHHQLDIIATESTYQVSTLSTQNLAFLDQVDLVSQQLVGILSLKVSQGPRLASGTSYIFISNLVRFPSRRAISLQPLEDALVQNTAETLGPGLAERSQPQAVPLEPWDLPREPSQDSG